MDRNLQNYNHAWHGMVDGVFGSRAAGSGYGMAMDTPPTVSAAGQNFDRLALWIGQQTGLPDVAVVALLAVTLGVLARGVIQAATAAPVPVPVRRRVTRQWTFTPILALAGVWLVLLSGLAPFGESRSGSAVAAERGSAAASVRWDRCPRAQAACPPRHRDEVRAAAATGGALAFFQPVRADRTASSAGTAPAPAE